MDSSRSRRGQNAVLVRHAYMKYGALQVLADLNMSVQKGTIYGLLGASGCGKTTLLSCVVGRRRLDSGEVNVLGVTPGTPGSGVPGSRIGYMPQETSVYSNFSIEENLFYFGMIFEMKSDEINNRVKFLAHLLGLADTNTAVKNLSGGQQRRVSLMIALLHDSELLVLDEPTAGMDPILANIIWEHLMEISSASSKTIIITTHYIEEARQAHTIGLMRNGCLVGEDSPSALMNTYGCDSLEEVFLSLSARQEENSSSYLHADLHQEEGACSFRLADMTQKDFSINEHEEVEAPRKQSIFATISAARLFALLFKTVLSIWRDVMLLLFFFGQSVVAVAIFHYALGAEPQGLPLAIVNEDLTSHSSACEGHLSSGGCVLVDLSCQFLSYITDPVFVKKFYATSEEALLAVTLGEAWGYLHFKENFTRSVMDVMSQGLDVDEEFLEHSSILVQLDMSNQVVGNIVRNELYSKFFDFSRHILTACGINPKIATLPIQVFPPVYGTMEPNFLDSVCPGLLTFLIFFLGVSISVWTIVHERTEGLLTRNIISGVTTLEIMLSYFLSLFVMVCIQVVIVVCFAFLLFHYYYDGSLSLVTIFLVLQGTCGLFYGFVISALCDNESAAMYLATGTLYPMLFICGILWPLEGLHWFLYYLSLAMPLTLSAKAMRWIMYRSWTVDRLEVCVGLLSTLLWTAAFIVVCAIILRRKKL